MEDIGINFWCEVVRVKTLADGSVRVEIELPEGSIMQAAALIKCQQDKIALDIQARPQLINTVG